MAAEEAFTRTTKQSDLVPCLCEGHRQHLVFSLKGLHRALYAQVPHLKGKSFKRWATRMVASSCSGLVSAW